MTIETNNNNDSNDRVVDDDKGDGTTKEVIATTTKTDGGEIASPTSRDTKDDMTNNTNENDETNTNSPTTNDKKENNEYDIVIVGTGLVESILSCALTMQHLKVLHIDEQEYYGQQDASLTLKDLLKWSKQHYDSKSCDSNGIQIHSYSGNNTNATPHYFVGQKVLMNPYGRGIVLEYNNIDTEVDNTKLCRLVVELLSTTTSTKRSKTTISFQWKLDESSSSTSVQTQVQPLTQLHLNSILDHPRYDRMCAFDLNSTRGSLVLSNGMAVSSLLKSKVSEYLEFKAIDKLQVVLFSDQDVLLTPVPCHKSDVFNSKLLQPLEKRKLMKLLQLVLEYEEYVQEQEQLQKHEEPTTLTNDSNETVAETKPNDDTNADNENIHHKDDSTNNSTVTSGTSTTTIDNYNERHLQHRGKSLKRPQNKKAATSALQTLLETYITPSSSSSSSSPPSFEEYLIKEHKMSSHLISIICHALCLSVEPCSQISVANGFHMLTTHMNSLGKFGSTAFITPLYGCGELSQAYCRKSAVLGTTYMLRQSLSEIHYNNNDINKTNITGVTLTEVGESDTTATEETTKETTEIICSCVILGVSSSYATDEGPSQASAAATPTTTTMNRISLLYISDDTLGNASASGSSSSVIQTLLAQSLIVVVPPSDKKNAVFITFKNHLVNVCCPPSNYIVVHMSTISTDTSTSDQNEEEYMKGVLQNVLCGAIAAATATTATAGGSSKGRSSSKATTTSNKDASATFNLMNNVELFHVCYSTRTLSNTSTTVNTGKTKNGLYKVESPTLDGDGISIDGYFEKAEHLFDEIMKDTSPTKKDTSDGYTPPVFLEMSKSLQEELEEAQKGYGGGQKEQDVEEDDDDDDM